MRVLVRDYLEPTLRPVAKTLIEAAPAFDALVAHHIVFSAEIAAEKTGVPWASVYLAPGVKASRQLWPGPVPWPAPQSALVESLCRFLWFSGKRLARPLVDPCVNAVREEFGLPPRHDHFFRSSPQFNLHLYSPEFMPLPRDWTGPQLQAGFCFWDGTRSTLDPQLEAFLAAGPKPWLVTLGSAVVASPGALYEEAAQAFDGGNRRAILLTGDARNRPPQLPTNVIAADYAPYGLLMPRCAGVIHQCGIGTTAQTLRAGVPSVACPYAFDQPNNAAHLVRLGTARLLPSNRRNAVALRAAVEEVENSALPQRAAKLGEKIRAENGPAFAADGLENFARARSCPQ
jgi:UDP:flavonoid glycosyltransferase YjiC (YdhE family)